MSSSGGTTGAPPPAEGSTNQTPSIPPVQIVIITIVIFGTIAIVAGISLCCRRKRQREAKCRPNTSTSTQQLRTDRHGQIQYDDWLRIAMGLEQHSHRGRTQTPPRSRSRAGQAMRSLSRRALRRSDSVKTVEDPPPRYEQALKDKTVPQESLAEHLHGVGAADPVGLAIDVPCEAVSPVSERSSLEGEVERPQAVGLGVAM